MARKLGNAAQFATAQSDDQDQLNTRAARNRRQLEDWAEYPHYINNTVVLHQSGVEDLFRDIFKRLASHRSEDLGDLVLKLKVLGSYMVLKENGYISAPCAGPLVAAIQEDARRLLELEAA